MFQNLHLLRNAVMFNLDIFLIFRDEWQRNRVSSCYQDIWPCSCSLDEIQFTLICFYLNFLPVQLLKKIIYKILWCSSVVKLQLLFVGVYIRINTYMIALLAWQSHICYSSLVLYLLLPILLLLWWNILCLTCKTTNIY